MAAANQLSAVPSPPDCQPAFSLSTPSPTKHCHCINSVVTVDTQACYSTTLGGPSLSWLPGNELCYLTLLKNAWTLHVITDNGHSLCFLELSLTIKTSVRLHIASVFFQLLPMGREQLYSDFFVLLLRALLKLFREAVVSSSVFPSTLPAPLNGNWQSSVAVKYINLFNQFKAVG